MSKSRQVGEDLFGGIPYYIRQAGPSTVIVCVFILLGLGSAIKYSDVNIQPCNISILNLLPSFKIHHNNCNLYFTLDVNQASESPFQFRTSNIISDQGLISYYLRNDTILFEALCAISSEVLDLHHFQVVLRSKSDHMAPLNCRIHASANIDSNLFELLLEPNDLHFTSLDDRLRFMQGAFDLKIIGPRVSILERLLPKARRRFEKFKSILKGGLSMLGSQNVEICATSVDSEPRQ